MIAGLRTGKNVVALHEMADTKARAHLGRLRDMLKGKQGAGPARDPAAAREAFERKRQEALDAIARMQAERGMWRERVDLPVLRPAPPGALRQGHGRLARGHAGMVPDALLSARRR
ncbi:MAG: hypothetical protein MZV65_31955 [Chromatiales bacterium]|nr:hypothetical protein [Chromatiales bacterium]